MSENTTSADGTAKERDRERARMRRIFLASAYLKIRQLLYSHLPQTDDAASRSLMSAIWATIETELIPIVDWGRATGHYGYSSGSGPLTR